MGLKEKYYLQITELQWYKSLSLDGMRIFFILCVRNISIAPFYI